MQHGTYLPNSIDYTLHIKITLRVVHNVKCIDLKAVKL